MFDWYQPVFYYNPTIGFPHERKCVSRWIGVAEECTDNQAYTILTTKARILVQKSVWAVSDAELAQEMIKAKLTALDESINHNSFTETDVIVDLDGDDVLYQPKEKTAMPAPNEHACAEMHKFTPEEMDEYLSKEVFLPRGGHTVKGRVLKHTRDGDGIPVGIRNANPILDTREYEVVFEDDSVGKYTANIIAEGLQAKADAEANPHAVFTGIVDHRFIEPVDYIHDTKGTNRSTTLGWDLCVQWTDGTTTWLPLATVKESNPVEAAEFAVSRGINGAPAYKWWARKA
jgi:hypothetical protein